MGASGMSGIKDAVTSLASSAAKVARTKLMVLGGVALIAVALGVRMIAADPQSAPAAALGAAAPPAQAGTAVAANTGPGVTWPKAPARDPFQSKLVYPPVAKVEPKVDPPPVVIVAPPPPPVDLVALAKSKIELKGTVLGEKPIAMMNGRVYGIGEEIEGFQVVAIHKRSVTLQRGSSLVVIEEK